MQIGLGLSPTIPMGVAVPAFTPASISGLQLWLDASDSSTLFQNSNGTTAATAAGDPVGYWGDKSGNGRHATQSDGTKKPALNSSNYLQNAKNGILGDGVNDYLITTASGFLVEPYTYFVVVKSLNSNRFDRIVDSPNENGNFNGWTGNNYVMFSGSLASGGTRTTSTQLCTVLYSNLPVSSLLRINGANSFGPYDCGSGSPSTIGIFAGTLNGFANVVMYEFLGFNGISDTNRNLIESYLNTKWGVY